jgi:D-alanine-D-alanine ligase
MGGPEDRLPLTVGLTYDLRDDYADSDLPAEVLAELDSPETIAAIEGALRDLGHQTVRVGRVQALMARLLAGERWDLVFNVAEGLHGVGREAHVPALLDAYGIPYTFSDPLVCALTLEKGMTKRVLRDLGVPTPPFAVVREAAEAAQVDLRYPLFAKPIAEGTSKGIDATARVGSPAELERLCAALLARFRQPVLVEEFMPGREVTVGILGTGDGARAAGVLDVILLAGADAGIYTYRNKEQCETLVRYELVRGALAEEAAALALRAWRGLGCRDGGRVDLRADSGGRLNVLEINPLAGLHPTHSDLPIMWSLAGGTYRDLIGAIVASARERLGVRTPRGR